MILPLEAPGPDGANTAEVEVVVATETTLTIDDRLTKGQLFQVAIGHKDDRPTRAREIIGRSRIPFWIE